MRLRPVIGLVAQLSPPANSINEVESNQVHQIKSS